jgi:hypothetical protein
MIFKAKDPKGIFLTELMAHQLLVESMYVGYLISMVTQQILMYSLQATGQEAQRK